MSHTVDGLMRDTQLQLPQEQQDALVESVLEAVQLFSLPSCLHKTRQPLFFIQNPLPRQPILREDVAMLSLSSAQIFRNTTNNRTHHGYFIFQPQKDMI